MRYDELSKDELIQEIKRLKSDKRYGLVFEEKPEEVDKHLDTHFPVLESIREKDIITSSEEPVNLLVEGDNLHSLNVLMVTHRKKIDLIIIDPPYNTTSKDFIYNDTYIDSEDAWRHSKWLSFMKRRLELARELLTDDGVMFIHIDENEFSQLKLLCDEILFEKNYIGNFIWKGRSGKGGTADKISTIHEYILCYAKDYCRAHIKTDKRIGSERKELLRQWGQGVYREDRKTMFFPLLFKPETGEKSIIKKEEIRIFFDGENFNDTALSELKEIYEKKGWQVILPMIDGRFGRWRASYDTICNLLNKDEITFSLSGDGEYTAYRIYSEGNITETAKDSILLDFGSSSTGTDEIKKIFDGEKVFNTVKPLAVTKFMIDIGTYNKPNAIIMDFFAGSGTVGVATMEYNKEHGGNRSFILCTNNEVNEKKDAELRRNGIARGTLEYENEGVCNKVTYPRISKTIKGYSYNGNEKKLLYQNKILNLTDLRKTSIYLNEINNVKSENLSLYERFDIKYTNGILSLMGLNSKVENIKGLGGNLKYYKTAFIEKINNKDQMKLTLASNVYEMLSLMEGCYDLTVNKSDYRIYTSNHRALGIYISFVKTNIDKMVDEIQAINLEDKVLYVFGFSERTEHAELKEVNGIKFKNMPSKILEMLEGNRK